MRRGQEEAPRSGLVRRTLETCLFLGAVADPLSFTRRVVQSVYSAEDTSSSARSSKHAENPRPEGFRTSRFRVDTTRAIEGSCRTMGPINVFVEAIGLVAIAYATFGVVSFMEVKNKYEGSSSSFDETGAGRYNRSGDDADDFVDFVSTSDAPKKPSKGKPKKAKGKRGGPRACLPTAAAVRPVAPVRRIGVGRFVGRW